MIYLDNLMTPGVYEKEAKNNRDKAVEALTKTGFVVSQEITVGLEMFPGPRTTATSFMSVPRSRNLISSIQNWEYLLSISHQS